MSKCVCRSHGFARAAWNAPACRPTPKGVGLRKRLALAGRTGGLKCPGLSAPHLKEWGYVSFGMKILRRAFVDFRTFLKPQKEKALVKNRPTDHSTYSNRLLTPNPDCSCRQLHLSSPKQ